MKKLIAITAAFLFMTNIAAAETVIVVDTNGNVLQKTVTAGGTALIPNQIVTTQTYTTVPTTTIVQETPVYHETYSYSNISAGTAILAGITTGIIGGLVYHDLKHSHDSKPHHVPAPKHHSSKPHHKH